MPPGIFGATKLAGHGSRQSLPAGHRTRISQWLRDGTTFDFEQIDVRDRAAVDRVIAERSFDAVIHLAAQVAVTTSVVDPRTDFAGERARHLQRARRRPAPLPGSRLHLCLDQQGLRQDCGRRARAARQPIRLHSIGRTASAEAEPLDFLSPYGCSKGAADQYTLDYARMYKIPATSFRQSCIYGPRQFGVEDQGWVAWFAIASLLGRDITIFGDGKQVRDVLHVDDLLHAYEAAIRAPGQDRADRPSTSAAVPARCLSLIDLIDMLETPSRPQDPPSMGRLAAR